MNSYRPKIWIDLDNAPHAHFFAPLVRDLEASGLQPLITVRSFGQTEELARSYGMDFTVIGSHKALHSRVTRVLATLARAAALVEFISAHRPVAAVSHGSRALTLAAAFLGIPCLALYDYEHISAGIFHHLCRRILVPEVVANAAHTDVYTGYPGFKEDVYVHDFQPREQILRQLALDPSRLIVTVRPPATWAHYHNEHSTTLFRALIEHLRQLPDAQVIVLARTAEQACQLAANFDLAPPQFLLLSTAIDGLSLICVSDAVFSGGGTMVREAALMGVAAYSTFAGKLGAVDAELERMGKLVPLRAVSDIARLQLHKRTRFTPPPQNQTRKFILREILAVATPGARP